jgi:hypothetical protein
MVTLTANPIEINTTTVEDPGILWQNTVLIKGLKDPEVEEAVNAKLQSMYDTLKSADIPAYRGIYQRVPLGTTPISNNLNAYPSFNYHHILSVFISSDKTYDISDPDPAAVPGDVKSGMEMEYVGRYESVNIDLRTGKEILLPELFADPASAMNLLNDAVSISLSSQLADEEPTYETARWGIPRLTTPFKGLNANQQFYLSDVGIHLIIDQHNPEFEIGFYTAQIFLPYSLFKGQLAIEDRFSGDASALYVNPEPLVIQFVRNDMFNNPGIISSEETGTIGKVRTYQRYRYPDNLPAPILERVDSARKEMEIKTTGFKDIVPTSNQNEPFYETSVDVSEIGSYYTFRQSEYPYGLDPLTPTFALKSYTMEGAVIKLEDCFIPGFDYQSAIYTAFEKQTVEMGIKAIDKDQLLDRMTFGLGTAEFEFSFPNQPDFGYFSISYKDLGCENLTVFE